MLTREDFMKLFANRLENADALNQAYADGTPDEQHQYIAWMEEANPPQEPDEDDPLAGMEGNVSPAEPNEELANLENAVHDLVKASVEAVNPRKVAERKRAQRSNMLRSIRTRYKLMTPFTVSECAVKIGRDPQEVAAYLVAEIRSGNGVFSYNEETRQFYLDNPFL
jgi:hypothetical protein